MSYIHPRLDSIEFDEKQALGSQSLLLSYD